MQHVADSSTGHLGYDHAIQCSEEARILSFTHSFKNTYEMLGTILVARDVAARRHGPSLHCTYILIGETSN